MRDSGLESSNLILGIDLTKSNEWTGEKLFFCVFLKNLYSEYYHHMWSITLMYSIGHIKIVGRYSFGRRCLHDIHGTPNPYEQAISIIGRTLVPFDEDNLVPCFGFGDGQ